ncbi:hypothetical protein HZS_1051, partial [Henneguya salminicola]
MNLSYCRNGGILKTERILGELKNNNGIKCKCEFGFTGNRCEFDCGLICFIDEFSEPKKIIECKCAKKSWLDRFFYKNNAQLNRTNVLISCFCFFIITPLIICLILSFTKYRLNK